MATVHYTARAKDSRTLELPEEAQALGLQAGDEVHIFVSVNGEAITDALTAEAEQERFRARTEKLYAETDATERQPGTFADPLSRSAHLRGSPLINASS
jgi:hypothetical protein